MIVDIECSDCAATGLYQGFCEGKDEAVVCVRCDGTGCVQYNLKEFNKRKGRKGIKTVYRSRGAFIATGVGAVGSSVTYQEFQNGKMPK